MSQLTSIAERIKAINTIQRTTHAIQLISMSTLSRVSAKKKARQLYTQQLEIVAKELGIHLDYGIPSSRNLYLVIGSQKGFCGSFNIALFNFIKELHLHGASCIAIGPYAYDFCVKQNMELRASKTTYSLATLSEKVDTLFALLTGLKEQFDSVTVLSNYNASIFLQRPQKSALAMQYDHPQKVPNLPFALAQPVDQITRSVSQLNLKNQLFQLLLESLRAENSARALSMDNSTRSAQKLIMHMKLEYNKLRQAKVTKELTELSGSLLDT